MSEKNPREKRIALLDPKKSGDHAWFLSLLDDEQQRVYEAEHMQAVMHTLRIVRIRPHETAIKQVKAEIARLEREEDNAAENYRKIRALLEEIKRHEEKRDAYRPFFDEPYFARMDLVDNIEGYNSYYIGKKGDIKLEIVDWRAPLARRYYQKSCSAFKINEYEYKTVLRRALRTKNGKVLDFKNEYLSLKDYLTTEEIADRDEENVLDPYLREIIKNRKEEAAVKDIIETIQEKQYEIITRPEASNFVLQGCAGSGKTMVMLHRLSYLMYNNEEIKPRDVLVITPSNSFNAFIDELAEILQLERVKTITAYDYFLQVLKNEKIDISDKIDLSQKESAEYLSYVYSPKFVADVQKRLDKVFDDLYGLFTGAECKEFIADILSDCEIQLLAYEGIKNASMRVRRAVLGEIKERKEGGLYYTKPFRELMNCVLDMQDFLDGTLKSENAKSPDYFYRHMTSFYKSASFFVRNVERIVQEGEASLEELRISLQKEIFDLQRFRQRVGGVEIYTYADRIARRKEIVQEIEKISQKVRVIGERSTAFSEFYTFLRGEKEFCELGSGNGFIDIARYFYRETVKKYKLKYGMTSKKMYRSDAYALCTVCAGITDRLSPVYSYVFVDEAQDISASEYALLRRINKKAAFNVFGDIAQNVTPWRGVRDWTEAFPDFEIYGLNQNYRNTNQIVDFVAQELSLDMQPIGFDGPQVEYLLPRQINGFFKDKKGLKAIICSEENKEKYLRKSYNDLTQKGTVSRTKINIMSVYESKGLEFTSVVVVPDGLSDSELYIAYTRALKELAIVRAKEKL
ncbi:MAG: UvrD-helicase domain-containing protein [Clostridia bacterium]|nr:UvrD-helicase domain-containing protein [Clostridia bacterium]